jgi:uncharacterized protein YbjT (DUF2867 family)
VSRILIVGGTGNIGREVVSQLAATGKRLRAMVRNPQRAALPPQAEVVLGDLTAPDTLDGCLEGIEAVFLVWTAPAAAIEPAVERIARHARRVVLLSAPLKTDHPLFQQPNPSRVRAELLERAIGRSGLELTCLRPGMFALNARGWWSGQTRAGDVVRWPYLDVPTAPIHEADVAAVAVRALTEDGHGGAEYMLTGAEALTHREQISTIGRAIGRPLRPEEMTPDEARRELLAIFGTAVVVNYLMDAWSAAAGRPAHVSSTFGELMGRPPRTFFEWATENAGAFRDEA